jgi:hypothetical protein
MGSSCVASSCHRALPLLAPGGLEGIDDDVYILAASLLRCLGMKQTDIMLFL